eukprot:m.136028 g.136028  ORF g.136028 m.136028 type:complete len:138 (+) comp13130_c0_seq6:3577-3990(+)
MPFLLTTLNRTGSKARGPCKGKIHKAYTPLSLKRQKCVGLLSALFNDTIAFVLRLQAKKYVQACDKKPVDEVELDYDPYNPFTISPISLKPIYKGNPEVKCPLCNASYEPEHSGKVCEVCTVAQVGKSALGLSGLRM